MDAQKRHFFTIIAAVLIPTAPLLAGEYVVVDTGQTTCYSNAVAIPCPDPGDPFYGQDSQFSFAEPSYVDNGDGTISDLRSGLMWCKTRVDSISWDDAVALAPSITTGGFTDWRLPSIKELYSLIQFDGWCGTDAASSSPFLDTVYFSFAYGVAPARYIDVQEWSSTEYVATTMSGAATVFGVNFADGRIKGYPKTLPTGGPNLMRARYVRGNPDYGVNDFVDNGDGTISDLATGLMWSQADSGAALTWEAALAWVQTRNTDGYLGHDDWRLPNAKELQSIVDYTRAPSATDPAQRGPAIDPLFVCTSITNEGGVADYPFYWASTTHLDGPVDEQPNHAVYVCFGRALGWINVPPGSPTWVLYDVHGAGAQRSDFKTGSASSYPHGHGPQGDVVRISHYVRCVRSMSAPAPCAGDVNCDGVVDFADIDPFVEALGYPGGDGWPHAGCPWLNADCNGDGTVDFADIDAFVLRLFTTCP